MSLFAKDEPSSRMPVSIITGFLGSGKTILLNKLLRQPDMRDTAVAIHGIHHVFHPPIALDGWPGNDQRSRIVFITRDLPRREVEESWGAFQEGEEA